MSKQYVDPQIDGWMMDHELNWLFQEAKQMENVVEIGSWKGKSSHALLSGCPGTVYCVDHFKELHSYSVPEIIALPIIGGNQDYLRWIDDEVKES